MKILESPPKIAHNKIGDALKYLKKDPYATCSYISLMIGTKKYNLH